MGNHSKIQVRPRFQRAFLRWFKRNRARFLAPLHVWRRTGREITLAFDGLAPTEVFAVVRPGGIMFIVQQQGEFFDALFDLDIDVQRLPGRGYVCGFCDQAPAKIYPTREALWCEHNFEEFLQWVNTRFAPAWGIRLARTAGGSTWATLLVAPDARLEEDPNLLLLQQLKPLGGGPPRGAEEPLEVRILRIKAGKPLAKPVDASH